jgi:hypothetical protein
VTEESDPAAEHDGRRLLSERIKSAILDLLIDDIRRGATHDAARSHYSKSDSGLYGKYQKADAPDMAVLDAIRANLQTMVDEALAQAQAGIEIDDTSTGPDGER